MAFIDLGNPLGMVVSGPGSEILAEDIGGCDSTASVEEYSQWLKEVPPKTIASECGACALAPEVKFPKGFDDIGLLIAASHAS